MERDAIDRGRSRSLVRIAIVGALIFIVGFALRGSRTDRPQSTSANSATSATASNGSTGWALAVPSAKIRGSVSDPSGHAVSGAIVCAEVVPGVLDAAREYPPRCVTVGEDTQYEIADLAAAGYSIVATAPKHRPTSYTDSSGATRVTLFAGEVRQAIDLRMRPGGVEVRGRVRDTLLRPIADAVVRIGGDESDTRVIVHTDTSGAFIAWVNEGNIEVVAEALGYASMARSAVAPGQFLDLLMSWESVLVGRVVDAVSHAPVEGALVEARPAYYLGGFERSSSSAASSTRTQSDGSFRIAGLPPGRYKPYAEAIGRRGVAKHSVSVGLGETSEEIVIEAVAALYVSGRVQVTGTALPCKDGSVTLSDARPKSKLEETGTIRDGVVLVSNVTPGTYGVSVDCDGFDSLEKYPDLVVDAPRTDLVWEVRAGLSVHGVVVDENGRAIENAYVDIHSKEAGTFARKDSGVDGTFTLGGLKAGAYVVGAWSRTHAEQGHAEVTIGSDGASIPLRLVLRTGGSIEGTVLDEDGVPVANARVLPMSKIGLGTLTRDDGTFVLRALSPGPTKLTVYREGESDLGARQSVIVSASEVTHVTLRVEREAGEIRGKVVDGSGTAVAEALVTWTREREASGKKGGGSSDDARALRNGFGSKPVSTDGSGAFAIGRLASGRYTLRAHRRGGGEVVVEHVAIGTNVTMTIVPNGFLSGTVVTSAGTKPEHFSIGISGTFMHSESFDRTDGRWLVDDLPEGEYTVRAFAAEGAAKTKVTLGRGETTTIALVLEPLGSLRGRIEWEDDGTPVSEANVFSAELLSLDRREMENHSFTTGGDGHFNLSNLPPGVATLYVFARAARVKTIKATVKSGEVADVPVVRLARRPSEKLAPEDFE